jgi:hypothetical protein
MTFDPVSASLDDAYRPGAVEALVDGGESLWVERKVAPPHGGLGATISAFANTEGGWLLLGVADDDAVPAEIPGFTPPGNAGLQDWLRDILGSELGDVPPFRAATIAVRGTPVSVVRVPPSAGAPHLTTVDGRCHIRENGRTVTVKRRADLIEILKRAGASLEIAAARLRELGAAPVAQRALGQPTETRALQSERMLVVLRAAPSYVPPTLLRTTTSRAAMQRSSEFVVGLAGVMNDDFSCRATQPEPALHAGGLAVLTEFEGRWWQRVTAAQDARGVLGVRLDGTNVDGVYKFLEQNLRPWLGACVEFLAAELETAGALGPAAVELTVGGIAGMSVALEGRWDQGFPVDAGNWFAGTSTLTAPADASARASLLDDVILQFARAAGVAVYSDD